MKEVVAVILVITTGVLSAQSIPNLVEQAALYHRGSEFTTYPYHEFICPDKAITRDELRAYNQHLGIRQGEEIGLRLPPSTEWIDEMQLLRDYSHPSSFISVTSNPSDRSASPAIF